MRKKERKKRILEQDSFRFSHISFQISHRFQTTHT